MKKLAVKRTHEKWMLAAIILSCGLVMQADPPARQSREKAAPAVSQEWQDRQAEAAHAAKSARALRLRQHVVSR